MMFKNYRARHPGSSLIGVLYFDVCCILIRTFFRVVYRARVRGLENIPSQGPLLIISNHESFYDPPFIGCWLKNRQLDFLARGGLFKFKPFGLLLKSVHALPIKQGAGDSGAMKETIRRLSENRAMLVFPEGARTNDGELQQFQRGILVLLKRAKCTVVPAAVQGPYQAWPRHQKLPMPFTKRMVMLYGEPITHDQLQAVGDPDAALSMLAEKVEALRDQARTLQS